MHKVGVVCESHLFGVDSPVAVGAEHLSVVFALVRGPVLCIYEISALEGLPLVVLNACAAGECRVELISLRVGDDKVVVGHIDTFSE